MRTGRTGMIAVVNFGGLHQLSAQKMMTAMRLVEKAGYRALTYTVAWFDQRANGCDEAVNMILDARVEGVLLVNTPPWFAEMGFAKLQASGVPLVSLGGANLNGIPRYLSDKEEGFYQLTRHVLGLGYRRIALQVSYSTPRELREWEWHSIGARNGFRRACKEASLRDSEYEVIAVDCRKDLLHSGQAGDPYRWGYTTMMDILKRSSPPEVVMCSNDTCALGGLRACAEAGVSVPEGIAVTGFENELQGTYGLLPLTSFTHPIDELTHLAVNRLTELIRTGDRGGDQLKVVCGKLVVRQSCGSHLRIKNQIAE